MISLEIGIHKINVEVANTESARQYGLMYRTHLPLNQGMLFIFEDKARHCFWMRNTLIPLSIAFIQDDGTIAHIEEMQSQTEVTHCAMLPVRYVIEMNQGWFKKRGIQPGQQIKNLR